MTPKEGRDMMTRPKMNLLTKTILALAAVLLLTSAALAVGTIPIPTQGLFQDAHMPFGDECEPGLVEGEIYLNTYHRQPDFSDPHQALSVSANDEQPFAWVIIPEGRGVEAAIFYVDSDRGGMAEESMPFAAAVERYRNDWCNVYEQLRRGKP